MLISAENKQECAMCLVRSEDRLLFVRQAYGLHLWTFPGGLVEPGESYAEAAIRELYEETGLEGHVTGLVSFRTRGNQTIAVFAVKISGGQLLDTVPGEIEATSWFGLEMLDHSATEYFSKFIAQRAFENNLSLLPYFPWTGGSGDADMFL